MRLSCKMIMQFIINHTYFTHYNREKTIQKLIHHEMDSVCTRLYNGTTRSFLYIYSDYNRKSNKPNNFSSSKYTIGQDGT